MSKVTIDLDDLPKGPKEQADELRDVWGELADHARRVTRLEKDMARVMGELMAFMLESKRSRRKTSLAYVRPAHWALVAAAFANLALVLWWAVISCGMGMSAVPGGIVCGIAEVVAVLLTMWVVTEAQCRRDEEAGE